MMGSALEEFEKEYGVAFEKITLVPLEGEGTIEKRVDKSVIPYISSFILTELSPLTDYMPTFSQIQNGQKIYTNVMYCSSRLIPRDVSFRLTCWTGCWSMATSSLTRTDIPILQEGNTNGCVSWLYAVSISVH